MNRREEKRVRLSPELSKLVDLSIKAQFEEDVNFYTLTSEERKQIVANRIWKQFFSVKNHSVPE